MTQEFDTEAEETAPEPEPEPVRVSAPTLEDARFFLRQVEDYLKLSWHDPRFGIRFAIGAMQLLQSEDLTVDQVRQLSPDQVHPVSSI